MHLFTFDQNSDLDFDFNSICLHFDYTNTAFTFRRIGNGQLNSAKEKFEETQRKNYETYMRNIQIQRQREEQLRRQEEYRRQNNPTFMEKVSDILNPMKWIG